YVARQKKLPTASGVGSQQSVAQSSKFNLQNPKFFFGLSLLLFAFGLMSKPMVVTLPFVLLLLDFWPLRRVDLNFQNLKTQGARLLLEKAPFFALAALASVVTVLAQRQNGNMTSTEMLPLGLRIENAFVSYAVYLLNTIWPSGLAAF